jgi:hypothetical protein
MYLPLLRTRSRFSGSQITNQALDTRLHPGRCIVGRSTDLVIEAYQRSGNTFAELAFRIAQPEAVNMAHHFHAPAQVTYACKHGIPTLVIIRAPTDVVISAKIRDPESSISRLLNDYASFYELIWPMRHSFHLASFTQVTEDFGVVIQRLNESCGTAFREFEHTEENVKSVFEEIEKRNSAKFGTGKVVESMISRPSQSRHNTKSELLERVREEANIFALRRAERIYEMFSQSLMH